MPDWPALVRVRVGTLPLDASRAADIVDEIAQHVAQHHADLTASGVDDASALRRALAPLDDPARIAAEIARADRPRASAPPPPPENGSLLVDLGRDVRSAARLLRSAPGFAAIALLTLALGIGFNTAIFSVLNAVLLRPLPYADPDRLVLIGERGPTGAANNVGYAASLNYACRSCLHLKAIGRLKTGTALEAARADVDGVQAQLRREHPADYAPSTMTLVPLSDALTGGIRPALGVLMGLVGFVLLIACANMASLLLARIARRERDLALRAALGTSRAHIVRQLMVEGGLLAFTGGLLGLVVSFVAVPLLVHLAPRRWRG